MEGNFFILIKEIYHKKYSRWKIPKAFSEFGKTLKMTTVSISGEHRLTRLVTAGPSQCNKENKSKRIGKGEKTYVQMVWLTVLKFPKESI